MWEWWIIQCSTQPEEFKAPFCDPRPHPLIFSPKKLRFLHQQKPLNIIFAWKIFLSDSFVWHNNHQICIGWKFQQSCDNMRQKIVHNSKCHIRLDWKLKIMLFVKYQLNFITYVTCSGETGNRSCAKSAWFYLYSQLESIWLTSTLQ